MYEDALPLLNKLLAVPRLEPRLYAHRGYALFRLERYAEAIRDFATAVAQHPTAVNTLFLLGRSFEELEKFDDAVTYYERVIDLHPDTADAHAHKGFCLEQLGRLSEALHAYKKALKVDPKESLALAGIKAISSK